MQLEWQNSFTSNPYNATIKAKHFFTVRNLNGEKIVIMNLNSLGIHHTSLDATGKCDRNETTPNKFC